MILPCVFPVPATAAGHEIAILRSSDLQAYTEALKGFKTAAPTSATYSEFDMRGELAQGTRLAKKIREAHFSLVVAVGLKASLIAKREIVDRPVLYMMVPDPLKHGLTADNMTGVLLEVPPNRQLKLLRTFLPHLKHVGMLYDVHTTRSKFQEASPQAAGLGFHVWGFPVETEKEVPQQLRALLSESEALWLIPDPTVLTNDSTQFILESALSKQIPVIGFSPELTRMGALFSMSIGYRDVGQETGRLAKRILSGEQSLPLEPIPVEQVTLTVNMKTARYLGIRIPRELEPLIDKTY